MKRGVQRIKLASVRDTQLRRLADDYLHWLKVRDYAQGTIDNQHRNLRHFLSWADQREVTELDQLSRRLADAYQCALYHGRDGRQKPMSIRNQHAHLVVLRGFCRWLARRGHLELNPAADLILPKLPQQLPRSVLSAREAELVMLQPDLETAVGLRDRAILETFYSTGMRRAELIKLKIHEIDVDHGTFFVNQGKGKKDRVSPIGERALKWIDKYLLEARPLFRPADGEETLFLNRDGNPLAPRGVTQMVRRCIEAAGIPKAGACHVFRHTMATLVLEGGCDVRLVQEMLGHAKLETTQIYTRVSIAQLKKAHSRSHPAKLPPLKDRALE